MSFSFVAPVVSDAPVVEHAEEAENDQVEESVDVHFTPVITLEQVRK